MTTDANNSDMAQRRSDLTARIAAARRGIAYADSCEKEAKSLKFTAKTVAVIKADADAIRVHAKPLLRILLDELKGLTS